MGRLSSTWPRLFVEADLLYDVSILLSSGQAHYLGAVLRRELRGEVRLFNGRDGEWSATIIVLERGRAEVRTTKLLRAQFREPGLVLVHAVLKRDASELIMQKATELGVTQVQPVLTERSQRSPANMTRLAAIAIEAAEQSERLAVPSIAPPCPLPELLDTWPSDRPLAVAIERSGTRLAPVRADALLIGPEGGFSSRELDATNRHPFVLPICLGPTVLRAETAAIVGLTLLLAGRAPGDSYSL